LRWPGSKQTEPRVTRRTKILLGCTALLVGFGLVVVLVINQPSRPAVEYTDQASIRAGMKWPGWKIALDRLLSLIPPLRKALNPTLNVNAALMEVRVSPELVASNLLSNLPKTVTNSLGAWVLTPVQLAGLKSGMKDSNYVEHIGNPRITTMEGVGATLSSGKSTLVDGNRRYSGVEVDVYPETSGGDIHLLTHVQLTDSTLLGKTGTVVLSLVTNFQIGLRASFPDGGAVFVLDHKTSNAVLISAHEQKSKK
jgi:hypothetical protein